MRSRRCHRPGAGAARPGDGALPGGRRGRPADELRLVRLPDRAAGLRGQGGRCRSSRTSTRTTTVTTTDTTTATATAPRQPCALPTLTAHDLRHHGDAEVRDDGAALVDLAVNVRAGTPPAWLRERIAASLTGLAAYPDGRAARAAVAARHGLPVERVLLTAGAAEAFVLLARALKVRRPVVVHPQFTEPEAALRDAGHTVDRVLLRRGGRLPARPGGRARGRGPGGDRQSDQPHVRAAPGRRRSPDWPVPGGRWWSTRRSWTRCRASARRWPGRTDVPGLVVLRSLTKTWGLAGLRIGYVLAEPGDDRGAGAGPAAVAGVHARAGGGGGVHGARARSRRRRRRRTAIAADRAHLLAGLAEFDEVRVVAAAEAPFVLVHVRRGGRGAGAAARAGLRGPARRHVPGARARLAAAGGARPGDDQPLPAGARPGADDGRGLTRPGRPRARTSAGAARPAPDRSRRPAVGGGHERRGQRRRGRACRQRLGRRRQRLARARASTIAPPPSGQQQGRAARDVRGRGAAAGLGEVVLGGAARRTAVLRCRRRSWRRRFRAAAAHRVPRRATRRSPRRG